MIGKPRVLIVDESDDSRQVLRTALERRGIEIFEATHARQGLDIAREQHPRVIVLDLEVHAEEDRAACDQLDTEVSGEETHLIVIGGARIRSDPSHSGAGSRIAKPYHFGPLIRKIESYLPG